MRGRALEAARLRSRAAGLSVRHPRIRRRPKLGEGPRRPVRPAPRRPRRRVAAGRASYCLICLLYSTSAHFKASGICIFWVTTCSNMRASTLIR